MADNAETTRLKETYKMRRSEQATLLKAWGDLAKGEQATQKSLRELRAKRASDFTKNAAVYLKSRDSGYTAQTARGAVDLAKLAALMPAEFARAATLPDRTLQTTITQGLSPLAEVPDKDVDKARKAWEMFLLAVQPSSANVLGSYEWMVSTYGDPTYLGVNNGNVRDKLAEVQQKVEVERKNGAAANAALEKLGPDSWSAFQRKNPHLDPEADSTYELFVKDAGIDLSIMPKPDDGFIKNIEAVAKNPEAHPDFFSDIDADIKESNEEQKRYEDKLIGSVLDLEGAPGEANDNSMRAFLAAWVRRPEVRWWAEQNGFQLGKAEPVDPESDFGKEVAAGRVPGQFLVNGMLYSMRSDDLRAFRLAHAQMEQDPEDNILRAVGLAHKAGPRRMVEVEEIVEPGTPDLKLVKQGLDDAGAIAVDAEGNYHTSTDGGKTWTSADKATAEPRMAAAEKAGDVDATPVTVPGTQPTTRTRKLEYREPVYGRDYPNSVRGVDPETGEEVYLPPEKVAKTTFPEGQRTKGPSLVERINQVSAKGTLKRAEPKVEKTEPEKPGGTGTSSGQAPAVLAPTAGFDHREAGRPAPGSAAPPKTEPAPRPLVEVQKERAKLRAPVAPTRESDARVATLKARTGLDGAAKVAPVPDVPRGAAPTRQPPIGQKPEAQETAPVPDASGLKAPSTKAQPGVSARDVLNTEGRKFGVLENATAPAKVGVDPLDVPTASVKPGPSGNAPAPLVREEDVAFKPAVADIEVHTTTTPTASTATDAQKKALEASRKRQKQAEMEKQMAGSGATPAGAP